MSGNSTERLSLASLSRYRLVKNKKVAIIGVVCSVDDGVLVLCSLTKAKLSVSMINAWKYKVSEALLLLNPDTTTVNGKWRLEINEEDKVIKLGKAVDFGFCCFKDSVRISTLCPFVIMCFVLEITVLYGGRQQGNWSHV